MNNLSPSWSSTFEFLRSILIRPSFCHRQNFGSQPTVRQQAAVRGRNVAVHGAFFIGVAKPLGLETQATRLSKKWGTVPMKPQKMFAFDVIFIRPFILAGKTFQWCLGLKIPTSRVLPCITIISRRNKRGTGGLLHYQTYPLDDWEC